MLYNRMNVLVVLGKDCSFCMYVSFPPFLLVLTGGTLRYLWKKLELLVLIDRWNLRAPMDKEN